MTRIRVLTRATAIAAATTLLTVATAVRAQSTTPQIARGIHYYTSQGFYDGEPGPPWESRIDVTDTTVAGKRALALTQRSHRIDNAWIYNYTAVWVPGDSSVASGVWTGAGREPGMCAVDVNGDKAKLSLNHAPATESTIGARAVPEFALAMMIASRPLSDGATIHHDAFRCSWGSAAPEPLTRFNFNGVVSSGMLPRGDKPSEPVWIVTGNAQYPFTVWIAKSDREVLKVSLPQGSVGSMSETFVKLELSK